ncbi:nitrate- and nitrite sensing domain-containing protein [Kordiimonas marina]|uniref:nitrate- and nitrite sensing domain-containing protein n=1 Tax=Kordiimonas marina TaxID=2872312 RepID=UPI001FF69742|nr:nitrate- and nitrite sensing domain-containing protein [Kordiimonas marina]MCJ9428192.1 nitrate- and nitrite sensing domain-containing protein [Kordiimonas marina]
MEATTEKTKLVQELLHKLGEVVHQIQRERGCAGLFLDSLGKVFAERFQDQNQAVDAAVEDLRAFQAREDVMAVLPSGFAGRLKYLFVKYDDIGKLRDKIRLLSVRYTQALNSYTFSLTVPTIDAMIELAQREPGHNSALVSAYANFLQWKERVGMERALGARGFHTFAFRNQEFCDRFVALIAEQKTYFETFKALASPSQIALLQDVVKDRDMDALKDINTLLEEGAPPHEVERYSGETWYDLLTRMIDCLHTVEARLVETLCGAGLKEAASTGQTRAMISHVGHFRPFLKSLPTFSGLEDNELDELLSFAQVREYGKDKLLFLRDEPAPRLYIVLEGWVKVYNGLESGEEAILQMLGAGETLLESAVFLNVPAPVNAQVVERALLLSIPAPIIRQRLHSNPRLAVNMLNAVSLRSQRLVQQIELSRLRTVQERVGWFLLRLAINQKSPDMTIHLPYEKSIIAAYLDMRPETFSRTLQKFRNDGFEVESDRLKMPDAYALCGFCDADLASQCPRVGDDACPHPEYGDIEILTGT